MTYAQGRFIHDADSHLMELSDCLDPYLEKKLLERYRALPAYQEKRRRETWAETARAKHKDPEFRAATTAIEERVQGAIVKTLTELKAAGQLRIDDVTTAAYVIQLSVEWISSRLILGEEGVETEQAAENAADMVCRFLFKDYA